MPDRIVTRIMLFNIVFRDVIERDGRKHHPSEVADIVRAVIRSGETNVEKIVDAALSELKTRP